MSIPYKRANVKIDMFMTRSFTKDVDIFADDLKPDVSPLSIWNIWISPLESGILKLKRSRPIPAESVYELLNGGRPLTEGVTTKLSFPVSKALNESINFMYSVDSKFIRIIIEEETM